MLIHTIFRIFLVSVCLVWVSSLQAQTGNGDYASTVNVVPEFYNNPNVVHSGTGVMGAANIQVDPHSGMLNISHTDVHIPGNGGMDLTLTRFYHSLSPETYNYYSPVGVGWSLHFGMIKATHPSAMCNPTYNYHVADNPVYVAPDGSQRVLALGVGAGSGTTGQFVDQEYFTYITQEFDVVFCKNFLDPDPSNDEIWMRKPDGMLYEFGSRVLDINYDSPAVWYVNKVVDPNGNYIEISYQSSGVLGNSGRLIDYIQTSDGRYVDFGYELENSIRARLSYIEYEGKRWDYVYEDSEVTHDGWPQEDYFRSSNLLKVTSPDGDEWRYSYYDFVDGNNGGEGSIRTITNPYGGITDVSYDVKIAHVVNDTDIIHQRVVTSLNEQGRESRTYTYEKTSDGDTTTVTSSAGETNYHFDGLKSINSGTLWRTGLLKKKVFNPIEGETLTTNYEYERKPISSENYIRHIRTGFLFPEDNYYYHPVLKSIVTKMDGEEWSQVYDYTGLNFGDDAWILFAPPVGAWKDESGPAGSRTRGNFYESLPDHYSWFLTRGSDGVKTGENSAVFDVFKEYDENGNVIQVSEEGKDTDFTLDTYGNVLSATTEEGVSTSYSQYLLGSPQRVVMPSGLVADQDVDEFGRIKSRSFEGRNESTDYDVAGRIQNVSPILGPDTNIEWSQSQAVLSRGDLTHVYDFDDFGRVVMETISAPDIQTVQINKSYDARDNLVSVTVNGSTITYSYDGYDRIVAINDNGAIRQYSYTPDAIFFSNGLGAVTTQYIRSYKDPFSYDLMGFSQEEGVTVDVDRNEFGRITRIASEGRERTYNYGAGYFNPIGYYESESGETKFYYNSDEQLVRKRMFGNQSGSSALREEIYSYDASGRLASREVSSTLGQYERTDYVYNELDEIVSVLKQDQGDGIETTYSYELDGRLSGKTLELNGKSFTTSYQYDQQRRPSQITYPSGNTYSLNANALGLLTAYEGFVTDAQYHYSGELDSITFSNGDVYDSVLNDRRVVSSVQVQGASTLIDKTYSYDDAFNFVSIEDSINPTRSMSANYDGVSRLIYASVNGNNYGYAYDDLNNIISVSNNSEYDFYSYDESNHLKSVDVEVESQYSYNLFGEVVRFSALGAGSISPGDFLLRRSPDGTVSRIETQTSSSSGGEEAYAVKAFRYDHRGYMVSSIKTGYAENDDLAFGPSQNYMVYDTKGRLIYEFNDRTKLKKEYHYLAGRLIGVVSDERTCDDDPDGDGMPFCFEQENGLDNYANDAAADPDQDGLSNLEEYNASSDPHIADTDADGLPDAWEVAHGLDPRTDDADVDTDGDGLSNLEEYVGEYDPTTPTIPDALAHVESVATENGLHISWDSATAPVTALYMGASPGTLAFHADLSSGQALVPYDDIPNEGYLALASTSNAGEAPLSPLVSFTASSDWAGFGQGGSSDFWVFLDQQGLGFAVDSEAGSLQAYSSGVMVDSITLDWEADAEVEYDWSEFEAAVLPNGDVVVAWITEDFANDVFAALYCLSEMSFCEHTKIDYGVESDTFSELTLEVIGENIVLSWFEEESYPPRDRSRLVIGDYQLNMNRVHDIDDFLPYDSDVVDLQILPADAHSFQVIRGVCCDEDGAFEIYANKWRDSDGLQEEAVIYSYDGPGASGAELRKAHDTSDGPVVLVRPDNTLSFHAISYDGSGWLPLTGVLSADDQDITVFDWAAVASADDVYVAVNDSSHLRLLHGVVSGPSNSWSGSEMVLGDDYDTSIRFVDLRSASVGDAAVLASNYSYSRFIRLDAGVVTASGLPPVSGGNAHFVSPKHAPSYLSVATTDKSVSRASVRRYQGEGAPADDLSLLAFSEVGYNEIGELEPGNEGFVCPQWSLSQELSTFSLAQISGPSFQQLSTEGPCYVGRVPYVVDPQIAVFDVTADMEGVPYDGQDDVVVPAFSPHVTVNGPASLIEGQSDNLSVSVYYSPDGEYYSRPFDVSWSQLSGPARPVAPLTSNGSDAVLWGPNVGGDQISVYSAEVYFPEADRTVTGVYEVEVLDTGGVVNLPPQLDLNIQPYSQWGYDMQKVTISSDLAADLTLRMYGSWSMLQDGNEPVAIPAGDEPEAGFSWQYVGPFSAILQSGQEIEGTVRAEATGSGLVSYLSFIVVPPAAGPIDPEVTVSGPDTIPDGSTASFEAITFANESGASYNGPVQYTWTQIAGPPLDITGSESSNPLEITLPEVTGSHSAMVQVSAYLPDEGMTVTAQKTFSIVDDESSGGQAPEITWTVEPYSAYGYDLNRVTLDADDATVHMKIYGSWTMLSDGNQPTQVPSGSEPEPNYQYEYVAPFSILREPNKEMDITIRAQSATSGLISYDRVIVDQSGGTAAPVN